MLHVCARSLKPPSHVHILDPARECAKNSNAFPTEGLPRKKLLKPFGAYTSGACCAPDGFAPVHGAKLRSKTQATMTGVLPGFGIGLPYKGAIKCLIPPICIQSC